MKDYKWYNELSEVFMGRGYFHGGESIYDRVDSICNRIQEIYGDEHITERIRYHIEQGHYVIPSPVWSNFGTKRGGGISCFGTYFGDSIVSIVRGYAEVGILCKIGGGTSGFFSDIRKAGSPISTGGSTFGAVHFMQLPNVTKQVISQGSTRRGEFAGFLDIDHGDIMEFLKINTEGHPLQRFPFGVMVPDGWIDEMKAGDMEKRKVWAKVLETRSNTGFPYIVFNDNMKKGTSQVYKDMGVELRTNMCTEIAEPTSEEESFVCDLMGMNLERYEQWKDTDAVKMAVYFADAVLTDFIERYKNMPFIERAVRFAERHRAIAIGGSGYHSFLQSKMIPFESMEAKMWNNMIWKTIRDHVVAASEEMAVKYGKPEVLKDDKYTMRHAVTMAIAPNTSSSFIMCQQSQSTEPYVSNYYIKKAAKAEHAVRNPHLKKLLQERGKDTFEVWESILKRDGSVQHLDFLTPHEKLVFRTFIEISQMEIIIQAAQRQKYIDQSQSLNLMIHPATPTKDVNALILKAHELGVKTLYYQLGQNAAQQFARDILSCESCAG